MTDYEIARRVKPAPIIDIAKKLGILDEEVELYGNLKAKIKTTSDIRNASGKLILVTSTSPTPYGEGKTTLSIGLHDSLCSLGHKSLVVLREPSLGPVFGTKGGATGGGMSQIIPMDDINLHFTGDIHAITSANNLLSAIIDNHIFQGNELNIDLDTISFQRCIDMNERSLRSVFLSKIGREESFNISAASEVMAILCLAENQEDLKKRLGNILVGYTKDGREVLASDLKAEGAMCILLKDAIYPNLVQTLEQNPAIIHGGPFANIAHGCNSVIATKFALSKADYVITEAGFGSDMGALKFLDIKCRMHNISPDLIIVNTTLKSLKYNGDGSLKNGLSNLKFHIENMQKFYPNILVVLNKFEEDTQDDINIVEDFCQNENFPFEISECYKKGSQGGISLAKAVLDLCNVEKKALTFPYQTEDDLITKIDKVCKNFYHASSIIIKEKAKQKLEKFEMDGHRNLPICIAKTQYSISDNPKLLGYPKDFKVTITDVKLNLGAGFITVYMGNIMTLPGLSKTPNYLNMDIDGSEIKGLF